MNETILCAALWYNDGKKYLSQPLNIKTGIVFAGFRHPNCLALLCQMFYPNWQTDPLHDQIRVDCLRNEKQGFLTSHNRFVERIEAAEIAIAAKQVTILKYNNQLYSEDLY